MRQRCGFGCVKCGSALYLYKYEHLEPEFVDATFHDPNGIILLCGTCAELRTKGMLSVETLKQHAADPACRKSGFSFGEFDISGKGWPELVVGNVVATDCDVVIHAMGDDVLSVCPPVEPGQPFRISALFRDRAGNKILEIVDNQWRTGVENWDAKFVGRRLIFRRAKGEIALVIRAEPIITR